MGKRVVSKQYEFGVVADLPSGVTATIRPEGAAADGSQDKAVEQNRVALASVNANGDVVGSLITPLSRAQFDGGYMPKP